jgi:hypothetical protein
MESVDDRHALHRKTSTKADSPAIPKTRRALGRTNTSAVSAFLELTGVAAKWSKEIFLHGGVDEIPLFHQYILRGTLDQKNLGPFVEKPSGRNACDPLHRRIWCGVPRTCREALGVADRTANQRTSAPDAVFKPGVAIVKTRTGKADLKTPGSRGSAPPITRAFKRTGPASAIRQDACDTDGEGACRLLRITPPLHVPSERDIQQDASSAPDDAGADSMPAREDLGTGESHGRKAAEELDGISAAHGCGRPCT